MEYSRRELGLMLPALAAAGAAAAEKAALPSKIFVFDELPVKQNGPNRSRAVFDGVTHGGCALEMHITDLAPGLTSHAPHRHPNDEMIIVREGTVEFTIGGKASKLGPGAIIYVSGNEEHGIHNVGPGVAQYFVIAFGAKKAAGG